MGLEFDSAFWPLQIQLTTIRFFFATPESIEAKTQDLTLIVFYYHSQGKEKIQLMSKNKTNRLQALFPGYIKKTSGEIASIWKKAFISIDANVLLNLYRYSEATSADFVRAIKGLKSNFFITNQAFEEYLKNKHKVISSQSKLYDTKDIELLKKILDDKNSHPFISGKTSELFDSFYQSLREDYSSAINKLNNRFSEDDIFISLQEVFEKSVLDGFDNEYIKDCIFPDGKLRYAEKIPPGYEDVKEKGNDTSYEGLRRLYGDLIVWKELIEYSKTQGCDIIFVTADRKPDWWKSVDSKIVSPRPELLKEFSTLTGHELIMYTPEQFLKYADSHLNNVLSQDSLEEVRQFEISHANINPLKYKSFRSRFSSTHDELTNISRNNSLLQALQANRAARAAYPFAESSVIAAAARAAAAFPYSSDIDAVARAAANLTYSNVIDDAIKNISRISVGSDLESESPNLDVLNRNSNNSESSQESLSEGEDNETTNLNDENK